MSLNDEELRMAGELASVIAEEEALDKTPKRTITSIVSGMLFGRGIANKRVNVRWGGMFSRQKCPVCDGILAEKDGEYSCGKCGIRMPADLYEKAREQHMKETELAEREAKVALEMEDKGMTPEKADEIYAMAIHQAEKNTGGVV